MSNIHITMLCTDTARVIVIVAEMNVRHVNVTE